MGLEVKNAASERPEIWVYGPIGKSLGGISDDDVRVALSEIPSHLPLEVRVNSDGGVFSDAVAMYSLLSRRKGDVHVVVDGRAYSAGSIVAMAGKTIEMARGSWMMIHEAMGTIEGGRAEEMRQRAEKLDAINAQIRGFYAKRWKRSENDLIEAMSKELWMKDEDAVALGMADFVSDSMAVAAHCDAGKFGYKNAPDELAAAPKDSFPNRELREAKLQMFVPIQEVA